MIRFVLLLFFLNTLIYNSQAQNCTVQQFDTQAKIDGFAAQYPGCTRISNTVDIAGDDITNLDGLSGLIYIGDFLHINNCPLLTDISGISSVTEIGGEINIENNPLLENLIGLEGLTSTNSNLRVVYNQTLNSISSLSGITLVKGFLSVGGNPALTSLSGLDNLTTINGAFSSGLNDNLVDLTGLNNLTYIGGFFNLIQNPKLTSVTALLKLTKVLDYVNVSNNAILTNLSGLDNIDPTFFYLRIENSPMLSVCGVKSICKYVSNSIASVSVLGNATGCGSREEILATSECEQILPVTLISFSGKNIPEGNLLEWQTSSELNNAGFSVESSLNAKKFAEIAFIEGNGTVNTTKNYSFTESMPRNLTYYRLKQSDFDKSFSYSKIIAVGKEDPANAVQQVNIYPNPARGELVIESSNKSQGYSLKSLNGYVIKEASSLPAKPIDTGYLPNGLYLLTVGKDVFKVMIAN
ncbi:T9SS type A sorting domain-containing protein [Dyadobacter arcticus]|uniref:Secretion system C-terminal sorting domain-containing protein n=1 Tax=Dyadobacter arcticus TaxID=1078754 RepID=A0ABX0UK74_9BACT|nr:T9SS type A sorting domain-containing protein [Dyadobacter arcticus]NIJ53242.1 hypothetical protein [Dyadobacter arcticus]